MLFLPFLPFAGREGKERDGLMDGWCTNFLNSLFCFGIFALAGEWSERKGEGRYSMDWYWYGKQK